MVWIKYLCLSNKVCELELNAIELQCIYVHIPVCRYMYIRMAMNFIYIGHTPRPWAKFFKCLNINNFQIIVLPYYHDRVWCYRRISFFDLFSSSSRKIKSTRHFYFLPTYALQEMEEQNFPWLTHTYLYI